ncbi:MAG: R3H domain-containing nucleic acid-binding protein [Erysipelotrichaceae bacterium]
MKSYSGKNLEDLLQSVAKEKGVKVDELTYFVTEEKTGFLGFGASVTADVYALSDVRDFLKGYLERFFKTLEQDVEVDVQQDNDTFKIMLNAENNAILIGKNGQTLTAINTVVRAAVNSSFKRRFNVMVDINNYKVDRYDKVMQIASRVARTVQRTKISATLDPMPNDERKVVHQFLSEMKNIRTESEGEGINRRLKIIFDRNKDGE